MKVGRSSEQLDAQIAQLEFSLEELEGNGPQLAAHERKIAGSTRAYRRIERCS